MGGIFGRANDLVEECLQKYLGQIEAATNCDCLTYYGDIAFGADDDIRDAIEGIPNRRDCLMFILETSGGFAETAKRIADTVRHHYKIVNYLVPSHAMSAGTILVMSGDAIHMDYYSVLGPIDPQIEGRDGKLMPALGYLVQYEKLMKKAQDGELNPAELQILLNFDQGELYAYEQARDLSKTLLEDWLVQYKFKDWKETETKKEPVTEQMKRTRAQEIADKLNNVKLWNSHGIGINAERLQRELNLKIDDFGEIDELRGPVRTYHKLLSDFMGKMRFGSVIHTREAFKPLQIGILGGS